MRIWPCDHRFLVRKMPYFGPLSQPRRIGYAFIKNAGIMIKDAQGQQLIYLSDSKVHICPSVVSSMVEKVPL